MQINVKTVYNILFTKARVDHHAQIVHFNYFKPVGKKHKPVYLHLRNFRTFSNFGQPLLNSATSSASVVAREAIIAKETLITVSMPMSKLRLLREEVQLYCQYKA